MPEPSTPQESGSTVSVPPDAVTRRTAAYSVGERVRFKTEYMLAVQDTAGTVKQTWPDGCIRVAWDSGDETYVETIQQATIERVPT